MMLLEELGSLLIPKTVHTFEEDVLLTTAIMMIKSFKEVHVCFNL
jgi:hypothetical protein